MIRVAKFEDIPRVIELLEMAHKRTIYASIGNVSARRARDIVEEMGARMESRGLQRTFFWVAVKSGVVQGFLIGHLQPIYQIGDKLEGTDLYTLLNERCADPADFVKLVVRYKAWLQQQPDVIQASVGITDIIMPNWQELVPVYEGLGFKQTGVVMTARFWQ